MLSRARFLLTVLALVTLMLFGVDFVLDAALLNAKSVLNIEWPGLRALAPHLRYALGAAGVLLPLMATSLWLMERVVKTPIVSKTARGGTIRLAPSAIERTVCREVRKGVADVLKIGASASQGRGAPRIEVRVAVSDRVDVPAVEGRVREETRKTLRRVMGIEDTNQVHVTVFDIADLSRGAKVRRAAPPARRPAPATTTPGQPEQP